MPTFDDENNETDDSVQAEPFSSTLSTPELLLVKSLGIIPVSQVMGTAFERLPMNRAELLACIYGTGYGTGYGSGYGNSYGSGGGAFRSSNSSNFPHRQTGASNFLNRSSDYFGSSNPYSGSYSGSYVQPVTGQISSLTSMRSDARILAVKRMRQEAKNLGASGVIAVQMKTEVHNWGDCLTLECTAMGTAVAIPGWSEERPFTSLMRAQQFWRLWQSGYQPCGIAVGACSYSDCAEASVLQRSYNQEVASYTASFYDAHALAMEAFTKQVRQLKGEGSVGMKVEYDFEEAEKELEIREDVSKTYLHLITHFVITGTAIKRRDNLSATPHQRTLRVLDLRNLPEKRQPEKNVARVEADIAKDLKE